MLETSLMFGYWKEECAYGIIVEIWEDGFSNTSISLSSLKKIKIEVHNIEKKTGQL